LELEHTFTIPAPPDKAWAVLGNVERVAPCMPGATLDSVDGAEFSGKLQVKLGTAQITYRGTARVADVDERDRVATIEAEGTQARGDGSGQATVDVTVTATEGGSEVNLAAELTVTGRAADFEETALTDVGQRVLDKLSACLAEEVAGSGAPEPSARVAPEVPEPREATPQPEAAAQPEPAPQPGASAPQPAPTPEPAPQAPPPAAAAAGATTSGGPGPPQSGPAAPPSSSGAPRGARPADEPIDLVDVAGAPIARGAAPPAAAFVLLVVLVWLWRRRGGRG
jgi:carbon monoxide dehydrogenase subunit G